MKRICLIVMLLALLLTGCTDAEPATVATISPGPAATVTSNDIPVSGNSSLSY